MDALSSAISEAARATTLAEIGETAFPALARALDACPVFLAHAATDFVRTRAIAGEHRAELGVYVKDFMLDDPLGRVAVSAPAAVCILERDLDRRAVRASKAYNEFHRLYDFEHHMLVRFHGETVMTPGALAMGFTRGRRLEAFGAREARIAELALPAFHGAAQRILSARANGGLPVAARHGLTRAEERVLTLLAGGLSNADIARRLSVSLETVKTHLYRVFRKLGVESRTQAVLAARQGSSHAR